ncbi:unnamed protein product, partial [Phaeothamnion confervicola]
MSPSYTPLTGRYGEQALRQDVRALLDSWKSHLAASRVLVLSVSKRMRAILFDGTARDAAPLRRDDPRLRYAPFMVGKPTFEEVRAVHARATTVTFMLAAAGAAAVAAAAAKRGQPTQPIAVSRAPGEERQGDATTAAAAAAAGGAARMGGGADVAAAMVATAGSEDLPELPVCPPSQRLIAACREGDMAALMAELRQLRFGAAATTSETTGAAAAAAGAAAGAASGDGGRGDEAAWEAADVINMPDGLEMLQTPLHIACGLGNIAAVATLLEAGADPCCLDVRGRTPYFLATEKE